MSDTLKQYFNTKIPDCVDSNSGWSGSNTLACNILLRTVPYGNSPYQIGGNNTGNINLYNTIHHNIDYKKEGLSGPVCSIDNITKIPCWGGLGVESSNNNMNSHSGCDGTNPNWTYPNKSVLPGGSNTTMPSIVDQTNGSAITIGQWKNSSDFGPKNSDNIPKPKPGVKWNSKYNFSTSILVTQNPSQGLNGSNPTNGKIYINYIDSTIGNTGLKDDPKFLDALLSFIVNEGGDKDKVGIFKKVRNIKNIIRSLNILGKFNQLKKDNIRGVEKACLIKIDGDCKQYPSMSNHDWFNDTNFGGPSNHNSRTCNERSISWKKSCKGDKYNLGPKGSESCSGESVSQANCFRVAKNLVEKQNAKMGRKTFQVKNGTGQDINGWGGVPSGCSVQSGGDWAVHYNTGTGKNNGLYSPVCLADNSGLKIQNKYTLIPPDSSTKQQLLDSFMTTFNIYLSLHKEIVINYSEGLPLIRIINNILIDEWVIKECDTKSTPMEKILCQLQGYGRIGQFISQLGDSFLNGNLKQSKNSLKSFIDICKGIGIEYLNENAIVFKAVSVALVMTKGCSITGNTSNKNGLFKFASNSGICLPDGCKENPNNPYCSCVDDNTYICPFESYPTNITACQSVILDKEDGSNLNKNPYSLMRSKIMNWLNTFVSFNGCKQRALAMKYSKCVKLNDKNLSAVVWKPNVGGFSANAEVDTNLYKWET